MEDTKRSSLASYIKRFREAPPTSPGSRKGADDEYPRTAPPKAPIKYSDMVNNIRRSGTLGGSANAPSPATSYAGFGGEDDFIAREIRQLKRDMHMEKLDYSMTRESPGKTRGNASVRNSGSDFRFSTDFSKENKDEPPAPLHSQLYSVPMNDSPAFRYRLRNPLRSSGDTLGGIPGFRGLMMPELSLDIKEILGEKPKTTSETAPAKDSSKTAENKDEYQGISADIYDFSTVRSHLSGLLQDLSAKVEEIEGGDSSAGRRDGRPGAGTAAEAPLMHVDRIALIGTKLESDLANNLLYFQQRAAMEDKDQAVVLDKKLEEELIEKGRKLEREKHLLALEQWLPTSVLDSRGDPEPTRPAAPLLPAVTEEADVKAPPGSAETVDGRAQSPTESALPPSSLFHTRGQLHHRESLPGTTDPYVYHNPLDMRRPIRYHPFEPTTASATPASKPTPSAPPPSLRSSSPGPGGAPPVYASDDIINTNKVIATMTKNIEASLTSAMDTLQLRLPSGGFPAPKTTEKKSDKKSEEKKPETSSATTETKKPETDAKPAADTAKAAAPVVQPEVSKELQALKSTVAARKSELDTIEKKFGTEVTPALADGLSQKLSDTDNYGQRLFHTTRYGRAVAGEVGSGKGKKAVVVPLEEAASVFAQSHHDPAPVLVALDETRGGDWQHPTAPPLLPSPTPTTTAPATTGSFAYSAKNTRSTDDMSYVLSPSLGGSAASTPFHTLGPGSKTPPTAHHAHVARDRGGGGGNGHVGAVGTRHSGHRRHGESHEGLGSPFGFRGLTSGEEDNVDDDEASGSSSPRGGYGRRDGDYAGDVVSPRVHRMAPVPVLAQATEPWDRFPASQSSTVEYFRSQNHHHHHKERRHVKFAEYGFDDLIYGSVGKRMAEGQAIALLDKPHIRVVVDETPTPTPEWHGAHGNRGGPAAPRNTGPTPLPMSTHEKEEFLEHMRAKRMNLISGKGYR